MFLIGYLLISLSISLMGTGGAILLPAILIYFFGLDVKTSLASSLLFVGIITLFRSLFLIKYKHIEIKLILLFGLPAILGTYFGTLISTYNTGSMQLLFYALLILVGSMLLMRKTDYINIHHEKHYWQVVIDGIIIGVITSFVGVGGSFLIVPALILMGGLELKNAIASSLVIVAIKSFIGFYQFSIELQKLKLFIDWQWLFNIIVIGVISLLAWYFLNHYLKQKLLKIAFSIILFSTGISILSYEFLISNNL